MNKTTLTDLKSAEMFLTVFWKLKKTLTLGEFSAIEWKKSFSKIYSTLLFCIKTSSKSTFVQSSNRRNLNE